MNAAERLAAITARADKATEGPWGIETHYGMSQSRRRQIVAPGWMTPIAVLGKENPYGDGDAEFIAHARSDVPWLVEQVRKRDDALQAVLEAHQKGNARIVVGVAGQDVEHCIGCSQISSEDLIAWPCPTVRAISAALGEGA